MQGRHPSPPIPTRAGRPRPDGGRRRRRRSRSAGGLLLGLIALLPLLGCGSGDDIVGSGPIRSVAVAPDGSVFVLRDWRRRTPDTAVLLSVDPATGRAAPVLPKFPGRRGATVRALDFAIPRPADASPWPAAETPRTTASGGAATPVPASPPHEAGAPELVIGGPEIGLAVIRGPFSYLGALPEVAVVAPLRFAPPSGGAGAAASPDGRRLLLFDVAPPDEEAATADRRWTPVVVDLRTMEVSRGTERRSNRHARWHSAESVVFGEAGEAGKDGEVRRIGPGGGLVAASESTGAAPARGTHVARGWTIDGDPPVLRVAAGLDAADPWVAVDLPGPPAGFVRWPSTPFGPDIPAPTTTHGGSPPAAVAPAPSWGGLAWTATGVHRVQIDSTGDVAVVELELQFDRHR